jgi:hypothetical protein
MNKNSKSLLIKILGSSVILIFLISQIDWDAQIFNSVLKQINLLWYLLSLTGVVLVLWLKSIRWNLLLKSEGCNYSFFSAFSAYMASYTIGLLTPGRIGEIARLYYVREEKGMSIFKSFKTIVTDRIFDFALLFWFGSAGILFFYKAFGDFQSFIYLIITGSGLLLLWIMGTVILKVIKSEKTLIVFVKESWTEMFDIKMIIPWILTITSYLIYYVANWMILLALGSKISLIEVGFMLSIMSLVTLIPITLAGFGTREASMIFLFGFYSLSPELAIVFSLLQFIAFFLCGGIVGWMFWLYKPVKLSIIKDDALKLKNWMKKFKKDDK